MGRLTVHPHDGAGRVGAVFVPDLAFEHHVALAARVAVGHEGVNGDLAVGVVEHEGGGVFALELAKADAGAEVLPADVGLKPVAIDGEAEPVRHGVGEDHAIPTKSPAISPSLTAGLMTVLPMVWRGDAHHDTVRPS